MADAPENVVRADAA